MPITDDCGVLHTEESKEETITQDVFAGCFQEAEKESTA